MKLPNETLHSMFANGEITFACVKGGEIVHSRFSRGIAPAFDLLTNSPELLVNAEVCDTIVGKAAAALFILGNVKAVYAFTISAPAVKLLETHGIACQYETLCEQIINRRGDGLCPFEQAVLNVDKPEDCLDIITQTLAQLRKG